MAGVKSSSVGDTVAMHKEVTTGRVFSPDRACFKITPGLCSIIKVEEVSDPLAEAPEKVAEALILFCQVREFYFFSPF